MDRQQYERTTNEEFRGRKVRTLVSLNNRLFTIPPGTICTIERKFGGFDIQTNSCETCGVKVRISKVPARDLKLIYPEEDEDST